MRHEDIFIGMEVRVVQAAEHYRLNTNRRYQINTDEVFRVTSVFSESVNVRTVNRKQNRWSGRNEEMSFSFVLHQVEVVDPNAPKPRRLGKKPEGDEFIGIDHPGIQWLFDDMGKYADQQGYCSQYDALTAKLGIPGRPRDFSVVKTIGGIPITATVKARSQREANEMVEKALEGRLPELTPEAAGAAE
jgi:hypothetical protein